MVANWTVDFVLGQLDFGHIGPNIVGAVKTGRIITTAGLNGGPTRSPTGSR
jgi:hypothetical protein